MQKKLRKVSRCRVFRLLKTSFVLFMDIESLEYKRKGEGGFTLKVKHSYDQQIFKRRKDFCRPADDPNTILHIKTCNLLQFIFNWKVL